MNIGLISTTSIPPAVELRPAELNTVRPATQSDQLISSRPVSAVDSTSGTGASGSSAASSSSDNAGQGSQEGATSESRAQQRREAAQLQQEQEEIRQLAARDREVRAHEQAHAAVGGQYAGAPQYQFQRGPDGVRYAVGGEVSIDVSKAATPAETIRKMQIVRRAALAPAEPSPQDRRVAAQAAATEAEARQDLAIETRERSENNASVTEENTSAAPVNPSADDVSASEPTGIAPAERGPIFTPFRAALPPTAISSQLQRAVLASGDDAGPGRFVNQLV